MNGIGFIVRDRSGWAPKLPLPRSRFRWVDTKPKPLTRSEIAFIRSAKGVLGSAEQAQCYQVTPQTIRNIWNEKRRTSKLPLRRKPARGQPKKAPTVLYAPQK